MPVESLAGAAANGSAELSRSVTETCCDTAGATFSACELKTVSYVESARGRARRPA